MNVTFHYKNGRRQVMPERYARVLKKIGKGTYLTRDMAVSDKKLDKSAIAIEPVKEPNIILPEPEPEPIKKRGRKPKVQA